MKTTAQLEAEIRAAEKLAADLAADAREARSLPFYGSGKARRIAQAGAGSTGALAKAWRLRQQLPAGHPMRVDSEAA
jgi:hypothetical protein